MIRAWYVLSPKVEWAILLDTRFCLIPLAKMLNQGDGFQPSCII